MGIHKKATEPVGITNAAGEPEIVLEIAGLTLSMAPPGRDSAGQPVADDEPVADDQADEDEVAH
jgi:hypothetical protein